MTNTERAAALEQALTQPKSASTDNVSVTNHSLLDQIALDNHLAKRSAVPTFRYRRLVAPDPLE
jgi:hypothetical protein